MRKIVILNHDPLTDRVYRGFCIKHFQNVGLEVEYVDLSNFYYPKLIMSNVLDLSFVIKLYKLSDIFLFIDSQNIKETVFIVEAKFNWKSRRIYRQLAVKKCFMAKISIYGNNSIDNSFLSKLKALSLGNVWGIIGCKFYKKIYRLKDWNLHFTSSKNASNAVFINHPDYEEYMRTSKEVVSSNNYIVFLDEYFPYHPELLYWFNSNLENYAFSYHKKLSNFFSILELMLNKPVVIAAHPKSNYDGNEFGNRKIIRGCTSELVRQAALVVLHSSTSLSFAILNDKPVLIVSSSEYKKMSRQVLSFQYKQAQSINEKVIDIDKCEPSNLNLTKMDFSARNAYKLNYLTSPDTCDKNNNEIIYSELTRVFK